MHILPITSAKHQSKPSFQARVPKPLVKQMLKKAEGLTTFDIKSANGLVYSIPAVAAAKIYAVNANKELSDNELANIAPVKELPSDNILNEMNIDDFISAACVQDNEGNTIFHHGGNLEHLTRFFENVPDYVIAETFTKTNNKEATAYLTNSDMAMKELMQKKIPQVASSGNLSIDESLKLLKKNKLNENLINFLEARKTKKDATSNINERLYTQILENSKLNVETLKATYVDVPIEEAAKFFVTSKNNPEYAELDVNYLSKASEDEFAVLLKSALANEENDCIQEICTKCKNEDFLFGETFVSAVDISKPNSDQLSVIFRYLDIEDIQDLYTKTDEQQKNLMHYAAQKGPDEFKYCLQQLNTTLLREDVEKILLMKDEYGYIPAAWSDATALVALDYFNEAPDFVYQMLHTRDKFDSNMLYNSNNKELVESAFKILQSKPDELAELLTELHGKTEKKTVYDHYKSMNCCTKNITKEEILKLATDSDLSIEKSISLLKTNNLYPQIVEFLQMQNGN